jgi:hypothetical protein
MTQADPPVRIDWRAANLRGASLSHMVLDHADLRGADLREVNFTHSSLRYVDLRGANVQGANFQRASLYAAKMQGVEAENADFRHADLRLVNWGGAYLQGAQMPAPAPETTADQSCAPAGNGHAPEKTVAAAHGHDGTIRGRLRERLGEPAAPPKPQRPKERQRGN